MFTPEDIIDYVQNSKKQVVAKLVTNEDMAQSLSNFIDAEADFTKAALKTATELATDIYVAASAAAAEASKKFNLSK